MNACACCAGPLELLKKTKDDTKITADGQRGMERLQCYRVLCYEVMLHVQLVAGDRERRDAVQLCKPEDDLGRRDIELLCCCDNNRVRQQIRHAPQRPERPACVHACAQAR